MTNSNRLSTDADFAKARADIQAEGRPEILTCFKCGWTTCVDADMWEHESYHTDF